MDKMAHISPVGIGKDPPDFREARSHGFSANVPGAADISASKGLEDAVLCHKLHENIDIVAILRVGKGLQYVRGHFRNQHLHDRAPPTGSAQEFAALTAIVLYTARDCNITW